MNKLFCANCGLQLRTIRKAVPKYGTILDLVEPHTCLETPVDPSSVIVSAPITTEDKNKFVDSLNGLKPSKQTKSNSEGKSLRLSSMTGTDDLRDRRFEKTPQPTSSAPLSVLDQIKQLNNSIPANDFTDSEMEG